MKLPTLPPIGVDHLAAGVAALAFALGVGAGWALWHPRDRVVETSAPAARQADGSLVLQRAPDAHAKPPALVPRGATLERVVHVVVQPKARVDTVEEYSANNPDTVSRIDTVRCPPVHVDLALVRLADRTRRVIASSPDGAVVGGVDIPVESAAPTRTLRWAAGALYEPARGTWGAFLHRDLGPLRLGVQAERAQGEQLRAELLVGLRF